MQQKVIKTPVQKYWHKICTIWMQNKKDRQNYIFRFGKGTLEVLKLYNHHVHDKAQISICYVSFPRQTLFLLGPDGKYISEPIWAELEIETENSWAFSAALYKFDRKMFEKNCSTAHRIWDLDMAESISNNMFHKLCLVLAPESVCYSNIWQLSALR